jgi:hypothetical protein
MPASIFMQSFRFGAQFFDPLTFPAERGHSNTKMPSGSIGQTATWIESGRSIAFWQEPSPKIRTRHGQSGVNRRPLLSDRLWQAILAFHPVDP